MKTKTLFIVIALGLIVSAFSQKPTLELNFTAENNEQYVPLDSIFIENLTQGGDTTLYAPDTVLVLNYVTGIGDNETTGENSFSVLQNYPNPFKEKTEVNLYLPERLHIKMIVRDILGRELAQYENTLNRGNHFFAFYSVKEKYYFLTVTGKHTSHTIKMLNAGSHTTNGEKCRLVYNEYEDNVIGFKSCKASNSFAFNIGDELRYTGYAKTVNEVNGSGIIEDSPITNKNYEFVITEGIPCPETPTVTYQGHVYNTIQIFEHCWLKENLNVGIRIDGSEDMSDNSIIEKYCYDDSETNCNIYGGLYQWDEMMQYTTIQGVKGICPPDWHLPTDDEWKILEGMADSQYGYPDPEWDKLNVWRGFDAGLNIKSTSGWYSSGNGIDLFGFTVLPGGYRNNNGNFSDLNEDARYWSSTEFAGNHALGRLLGYNHSEVFRFGIVDRSEMTQGRSVRCVMD